MTIQEIIRIFKKWMLLIILLPVVTMMATGFYFYQIEDEVYTSKAEILVYQQRSDALSNSDLSTAENLINDFCHLVVTSSVLETVADEMGVNLSRVRTCSINVNKIESTRIVQISVTGTEPQLCYDVCRTLTDVASEYAINKLNANMTSVVENANLPKTPSGPARLRNTIFGFLIGFCVAVGIAMVVELTNTTIRTQEDVERILELPVLAKIPKFDK